MNDTGGILLQQIEMKGLDKEVDKKIRNAHKLERDLNKFYIANGLQ